MSQKSDLRSLIKQKTRRLQKLKEQEAISGLNTDPGILLQIEDLEAEIAGLQAELDNLPSGDEVEVGNQDELSRWQDSSPGGKRIINTGGGAYIEGNVSTGGGDFVGRDQVKTTGLSGAEVAQLFERIYDQIETHPELEPEDKADLKVEVEELQAVVTKKDEVDESFLSRRLRNIKRMAPDILDVVVATLTNPAAGFGSVVTKVAQRMKQTGSDS